MHHREKEARHTPGVQASNSFGDQAARAKEFHLRHVAIRVRNRCGACPQAKGVAQEIMFSDRLNAQPAHIISRIKSNLTKSPHAETVDVVLTRERGRGLLARFQVKDTTSASGIQKTLQQVKRGKYRYAKLVGSPETVREYTKAGGQAIQQMESTGISSATSTRVAVEAGCKVRGADALRAVATDIGRASAGAATLSGGVQVIAGVVCGVQAIRNGAAPGDVVKDVAVETVATAASSGAKTATALAIRHGLHVAAEKVAVEGLKGVLKSNAVTTVVFGVVEQGFDTIRLTTGGISPKEYRERTCANVGSTGGAVAGAAVGTALLPGVGTVIGGIIGGLAGQLGGGSAGSISCVCLVSKVEMPDLRTDNPTEPAAGTRLLGSLFQPQLAGEHRTRMDHRIRGRMAFPLKGRA
jgi:hypothetical protein